MPFGLPAIPNRSIQYVRLKKQRIHTVATFKRDCFLLSTCVLPSFSNPWILSTFLDATDEVSASWWSVPASIGCLHAIGHCYEKFPYLKGTRDETKQKYTSNHLVIDKTRRLIMIQTTMKKVSLVISLRLSVTKNEKIHRLRETKIIASFIFIFYLIWTARQHHWLRQKRTAFSLQNS